MIERIENILYLINCTVAIVSLINFVVGEQIQVQFIWKVAWALYITLSALLI